MEETSTTPDESAARAAGFEAAPPTASSSQPENLEEPGSKTKLYAVLGALVLLLLFVAITGGLYMLGDDNQSALERLRDIAIIYIVLTSMIIVVLLGAATAALIYLVMQIKNQVIPLLQETSATVNRVRGTTEFMTDEAVKPIISAAGKMAQWRAMVKVISGR
jgi:hypothetical protein